MSGDVPRSPGTGQDPPARHLKLVHPAPPPQPKQRAKKRPIFTTEEDARLKAALRNARALFGTWACLADALHVTHFTLFTQLRRNGRVTASTAVRLARALGKPLESLYRAPSDASTCPTCGARRAP